MSAKVSGAAPRAVAARALNQVLEHGRNLDDALAVAKVNKLPARDRSLAVALAYGATRTHFRNAELINALADRPFRQRDQIVVALLSVGLYALTESRGPDYAVVSATVAAAPLVQRPQLKGLVNALLRRFLREQEELLAAADSNEEAHWQQPAWLIEALRKDWPEDWQDIVQASNVQAPMWVRVNLTRTSRAAWVERLPAKGAIMPAEFPAAVMLPEPLPVEELPDFALGYCSVQDVASQAAAPLLGAAAGMRVLDACAAPGGKTTHIGELDDALAELVAVDHSAERLTRVNENCSRLGIAATVLQGDARRPDDWWDGAQFDRILVDAPCSATGVVRRHPDIRFLRRATDIEQLANEQLEFLKNLWPLLRPGGRLLYSTCSVLHAENEAVVKRFLDEESSSQIIELKSDLPEASLLLDSGVQLLPGRFANDGFYYALMERQYSP